MLRKLNTSLGVEIAFFTQILVEFFHYVRTLFYGVHSLLGYAFSSATL